MTLTEQDHDDVTNDTPETFGVLDEVATMSDNATPSAPQRSNSKL